MARRARARLQVVKDFEEIPGDDCSPPLLSSVESSRSALSLRDSPLVEVVSSASFNPSPEEVLRWATTLYHCINGKNSVQVILRASEGNLLFLLDLSETARDATHRLPAGLTLRAAPRAPRARGEAVARAHVNLPRDPRVPHASPDPLGEFARAFATVRDGEDLEVVLELSRGHAGSARAYALVLDVARGRVRSTLAGGPETPASQPASAEPFFAIRAHVRATADTPERSRELALAGASPFHIWGPAGSVKVSFRPRLSPRRSIPHAALGAFLLPPTASCSAPNVARTAASAPIPPDLPLATADGTWPLGTPEGYPAAIGVPAAEQLFMVIVGKPDWGKTSLASTQFLSHTRGRTYWRGLPCGGAFIDPHRDAVREVLPYFWDCPERVLLLDLGGPWEGMRVPVYNALDCAGCGRQEIHRRISAVVGGMSVAARWDSKATRAIPIARMLVKTLAYVNYGLSPGSPVVSVFQIPRLLGDDEWCKALVSDRRMPADVRAWWRDIRPIYKPDVFAPILQVVQRMRDADPLAAFLGGRSTFTPREAMDDRLVFLFGGWLSGDEASDRLPVSLLLRMLIQGAYSRGDVAKDQREELCPPFWTFVDELPSCDGPDLAKMFMELRKFYFRLAIMGVDPDRFLDGTRSAAFTAASILDSTALTGAGASQVAGQPGWAPFKADLGTIQKYHHLASITYKGQVRAPIAFLGMQPSDLFEAREGVVEDSLAGNARYRLVSDVLAEIDSVEDGLLAAWTGADDVPGSVALA